MLHAPITALNYCNSLLQALHNRSDVLGSCQIEHRHDVAPRGGMHGLKRSRFVDPLWLLGALHVPLLLTIVHNLSVS